MHPNTRHFQLWLYVLALLVCAAWFGIHWPHNSLWYDETTVGYVIEGSWPGLWHWATTIDLTSQLPLYLVLMKLWLLPFSPTATPIPVIEFALRASSVFVAFLSVAGMIALGKRLAGTVGGIGAGLILASLPAFAYITFEVRVYGLTFALTTWSYVFLWVLLVRYGDGSRPIDRHFWRALIGFVGCASGALYGHYTALLIAPVDGLCFLTVILYQIARRGNWRRPFLIALLAGGLVALAYLPWLPMVLSSNQLTHLYFEGRLTLTQIETIIENFTVTGQDQVADSGRWLENSALIALALFGFVWLVVQPRLATLAKLLFTLGLAFIPVSLMTLIVLNRPKLTGRYVWPMWIGLALLGGLGVAALRLSTVRLPRRIRSVRLLLPAAALLVVTSAPWLSGQAIVTHNSDFRGAFAYLRAHWLPGDLLVLRDGTLVAAAEFYQSPHPYLGLPGDLITDVTHILQATEAADALKSQPDSIHRVWVLAWQGNVMDPQAITENLLDTIAERQPADIPFGDVGLESFTLREPLASLRLPDEHDADELALPNGLTLHSAQIVSPLILSKARTVDVYSWWKRIGPPVSAQNIALYNDARISFRLIDAQDKILAQVDQPPTGWYFFTNRWETNKLTLGRYTLTLPDAVPPGVISAELVLYHISGGFKTITLQIGRVTVR